MRAESGSAGVERSEAGAPPGAFLLLAGGESRRMGTDKARLPVDGQPLLIRLLDVGARVADELVLAPGDPERYAELLVDAGWRETGTETGGRRYRRDGRRLRVVPDHRPGGGPLSGIAAGLGALGRETCFVAACDLPTLTDAAVRAVLETLAERRSKEDSPGGPSSPRAVVPFADGRLQPLAAAYERRAGRVAAACLDGGTRKVEEFLARLRTHVVPFEALGARAGADATTARGWFANANRPGDLETATENSAVAPTRTDEERR